MAANNEAEFLEKQQEIRTRRNSGLQKEESRNEICRSQTTVAKTEDRWKSRRRW